jgi:hypothetical protein
MRLSHRGELKRRAEEREVHEGEVSAELKREPAVRWSLTTRQTLSAALAPRPLIRLDRLTRVTMISHTQRITELVGEVELNAPTPLRALRALRASLRSSLLTQLSDRLRQLSDRLRSLKA